MRQAIRLVFPLMAGALVVGSCTQRAPTAGDGSCDPLAADCEDGLVCDPALVGDPVCVLPVMIRGIVEQLSDQSPIEGALVQAVDVNGAAVGTSGVTDSGGQYTLTVPAVRDEEGSPVDGVYTLRVQAAGYQEFPTAIRPALPLDASAAEEGDEGWVIENPLTTVGLLVLPGDLSQLGSISGEILADAFAGILVVAEGGDGAYVGFSDSSGVYTIFNVPAGMYAVQGYAAGVQFDPVPVNVEPSEAVVDVDLVESTRPTSTVSGNVQIVNAPGGSVTSVVLAVESTFVESVARGAVPPGLRIGGVTGAFAIAGVPDGRYVVLAAFENDDLVRDPDENIAGTQVLHIEVPDPVAGNAITISDGFKITAALAVIFPGSDGPQSVTDAAPVFEWQDDSSEDGYEIFVFDAFGNQIWADEIGSFSGGATVTHPYAGPPLEVGMFYQFRVFSFRERGGSRSAISSTEDLKGVFFLAPP